MSDAHEKGPPVSPPEVTQAHTRCEIVVGHPPERPDQKHLVLVVDINCQACQVQLRYWIPGHHLKLLRLAADKAIEQYPDLCRSENLVEIPQGAIFIPGQGGPSGKPN